MYENEILDKAILNIYPNSRFSHLGTVDTIESLKRDMDLELVRAEVIRLQAEYDALEYARNRASAYPSNGDQWDMIYKDMKNNTTTHADAVEAVKTKYPKPE